MTELRKFRARVVVAVVIKQLGGDRREKIIRPIPDTIEAFNMESAAREICVQQNRIIEKISSMPAFQKFAVKLEIKELQIEELDWQPPEDEPLPDNVTPLKRK